MAQPSPAGAPAHHDDRPLRPGEVAARLRVSPKTVGRWAEAGVLPVERTAGGHRRFQRSDVEALAAALGTVGGPGREAASVDA
jgi:excisionase family DNA binding protein